MTDEQRPAHFTPRDAWEAFDRLRTEVREARHSQSNLTQRAIHESATAIKGEIAAVEVRVRGIENTLSAAAPVSLGSRINDLERWQSRLDGETSLPARLVAMDNRIDDFQSWRDEMRGSYTFIKAVGVVLSVVTGAAVILSWISLQRPVP